METVTISAGYRIVIPRAARESLDLRPGQEVHVVAYENRIVLIPPVAKSPSAFATHSAVSSFIKHFAVADCLCQERIAERYPPRKCVRPAHDQARPKW
jgi:AbrB family looped-hinge helix DNA binding protein